MKYYTVNMIAVFVLGPALVSAVHAQSVSFRKDVSPILVKRCLTCHGEQKFKGEYQLDTFAALMKPVLRVSKLKEDPSSSQLEEIYLEIYLKEP